jgi:hypothetical protein
MLARKVRVSIMIAERMLSCVSEGSKRRGVVIYLADAWGLDGHV